MKEIGTSTVVSHSFSYNDEEHSTLFVTSEAAEEAQDEDDQSKDHHDHRYIGVRVMRHTQDLT